MFFKKRKVIKLSRIAKNAVDLFNINVVIKKNFLKFIGPLGFFFLYIPSYISVCKINNYLYITSNININKFNSISGTIRSLVFNVVFGLINFYIKKLLLSGVGYKAIVQFKFLYLYLGFSHPIKYNIPCYIKIDIISFTEVIISGIDKQRVSQVASIIRNYKLCDQYKGKGIRFLNEKLILKEIKKK